MMEPTGLSKKEYLKKYLSGGDKKKKKKKPTQNLINKSKIVDDDIDLKNMKPIDEDELEIFDLAEEAPQIAGIIDERPEEIRLMSEYRGTKKWKIVTDEYGIADVKITAIDRKNVKEDPPKTDKEITIEVKSNSEKKYSDSDESPPRKKSDVDSTALKRVIKKEPDVDVSSKSAGKDRCSSDSSSRRRSLKKEKDMSPVRNSRKEKSDSDASPPRRSIKKEKHSDSPPPSRKQSRSESSPSKKSHRKDDSDASPPRRRHHKSDSDSSPPRRKKKRDHSDSPQPRRRKHKDDSDSSPPRKKHVENSDKHRGRDSDSETRTKRSASPSGKKNGEYGLKLSSSHDSSKKQKKSSQLEKTLSGKKAGLQSAEDMKKESESLKRKEKEMFEKMSDEATGRHATAVVRNRRTGRRHDPKEEARKKREKEEKEAEKIAQYAVWGKGVKQVQDRQDKIKEDLYEMSKPLARYKDDKDLEEMLKNQEREGDPMLEYIRRKKKSESGPSKPEYEGSYMPNRYGIKPGHKWDGVDRSNGYEKKWFEEQNAKKAREEEAFKWSTIDM